MPTYSYRCKACGYLQVLRQNMQESIAPACPRCGGFAEKTIHEAPGIIKKSSNPPTEQPASTANAHHCGSSCVLHQNKAIKLVE